MTWIETLDDSVEDLAKSAEILVVKTLRESLASMTEDDLQCIAA